MNREKRYSVILLTVLIILLGAFLLGGYMALDHLFPMAGPIDCPYNESILSVSVSCDSGVTAPVQTDDLSALFQYISAAQPTRKMSVNDYPATKSYYTVRISTSKRDYRYFIYAEDSRVYVEIPYEGIYTADPGMLDFLAACCDP